MCSWRNSTRQQYRVHIRAWHDFCLRDPSLNAYAITASVGINFLTTMFDRGLGYSSINTARAALSAIVTLTDCRGVAFGTHPLVHRFMKGVFNKRPSLPRYSTTWDPTTVLDYLKQMPLENIKLQALTFKLVMLLALCSSQRLQGLKALSLDSACLDENKCVFYFDVLLKTSRPGKHAHPLEISRYNADIELCPVSHLLKYIQMTKSLRGDIKQLLISYVKPYGAVTTDTISRWLKVVMTQAGIDTNIFKAHSTRSASSSKAITTGAPIDVILSKVGWTKENTFRKFYSRSTIQQPSKPYSDYVLP